MNFPKGDILRLGTQEGPDTERCFSLCWFLDSQENCGMYSFKLQGTLPQKPFWVKTQYK